MKTYYKVIMDGCYSGIQKTTTKPEEYNNIFRTLREAKKEILDNHRNQIQALKDNMAWVKDLKRNSPELNP